MRGGSGVEGQGPGVRVQGSGARGQGIECFTPADHPGGSPRPPADSTRRGRTARGGGGSGGGGGCQGSGASGGFTGNHPQVLNTYYNCTCYHICKMAKDDVAVQYVLS